MIHPSAVISSRAHLAHDVEVGPGVVIEDGVTIGPGVRILHNAHICRFSEIGDGTEIHMGAVIGDAPQDLASKGGRSFVKIGKRNIIREYVTIHRGTEEGSATIVGDDNFFMVNSHIAHNCRIGNRVILCNGALLGGYVEVEDQTFISGNVAVHQFGRVGRLAMIAGLARVDRDVPPYFLIYGDSEVRGLNNVGLRRAGISPPARQAIKECYRLLYLSDLNTAQAVEKIASSPLMRTSEVKHLISFIQSSKRGICSNRKAAGKEEING